MEDSDSAEESKVEQFRGIHDVHKTETRKFLSRYGFYRQKGDGHALHMVDLSGGCVRFHVDQHSRFKTLEEVQNEFFKAALKDRIANRPFYLCWQITDPYVPRPWAIDFDFHDPLDKPLTDDQLNAYQEVVREIINEFMGGVNPLNDIAWSYSPRTPIHKIINGQPLTLQKVGLHGHGFLVFLTRAQCLTIRHNLILVFNERYPRLPSLNQNPWDKVIDNIYDNGLRMNWSNKADDCDSEKHTKKPAHCYTCGHDSEVKGKIDLGRPYNLLKITRSNGTRDDDTMERIRKDPILELKITRLWCWQGNRTPELRADYRLPAGRSEAPPELLAIKPIKKDGTVARKPRNRTGKVKISKDPLKDGALPKSTIERIREIKSVSVPGYDPDETKHSLGGAKVFLSPMSREWQVFSNMRQFLCDEHKNMLITKIWTNVDHTYYMIVTDSHWCANKASAHPEDGKHHQHVYFFSGIKSKKLFQRCFSKKDPGSGVNCQSYYSPGVMIPEDYLCILYPSMYPVEMDNIPENRRRLRKRFADEAMQAQMATSPLPLDLPSKKAEQKKREQQQQQQQQAQPATLFALPKRSVSLPVKLQPQPNRVPQSKPVTVSKATPAPTSGLLFALPSRAMKQEKPPTPPTKNAAIPPVAVAAKVNPVSAVSATSSGSSAHVSSTMDVDDEKKKKKAPLTPQQKPATKPAAGLLFPLPARAERFNPIVGKRTRETFEKENTSEITKSLMESLNSKKSRV